MEGRIINNISAFTYGKYIRTEKIGFRGSYDFKQGDTLKGIVVKQDDESNEVTIKLTNGMEIEAEIQGDVDLKGGILKFEVTEFKNNTLFLKLSDNKTEVIQGEAIKKSTDEIMNFIIKEGLKKEDYNMLKAMVKYNIPLTRENITTVKSVLEFSGKMNNNPQEIKSFINTYLNSRDIVVNSREGLQIAQKIYEFFKAFSQADLQEVLLFLENNIEFTKENLDSFNKLFNSENTMEKVIDEVNEKIGKAIAIEDDFLNKETVNNQTLKQITLKDIGEHSNIGKGTEKTIMATLVKESSKSQSINDNIVRDIIKNHSITDDDAKEIIKLMRNDSNYVMSKEVIRNIISNLKEGNGNSAQILNIMKSSINDLKLFNKINDQYYCLDVPVNFKENEYPCKLIIKDDRKDGKVIDSTNFKVAVSVKTKKLGTVDAFLNVRNRNIDIQLKCNKNVMNLFVISKNKLKDIVESSGFSTKIEVIERTEELQLLSCREFFNDNNIAVVDITV